MQMIFPYKDRKPCPLLPTSLQSPRSSPPQFTLTLTFYPRSTALPMMGFLVPAFRQSVCSQWLNHILSALQSIFNKVKTHKTAEASKNTRAEGTWEITWFSCFFWQMEKLRFREVKNYFKVAQAVSGRNGIWAQVFRRRVISLIHSMHVYRTDSNLILNKLKNN